MRILFLLVPLLLPLACRGQTDTVSLKEPFADTALDEGRSLVLNYADHLDLRLHKGALLYHISFYSEPYPEFSVTLDTAKKQIIVSPQADWFWGRVSFALILREVPGDTTQESLIDEFDIEYGQLLDDPVYYSPIAFSMIEDVADTLNFHRYFFDYEKLPKPYQFSIAKPDPGADLILKDSILIIRPKPDFFGDLHFALKAVNALDSQKTATVDISVKNVNDTPRVINSRSDTAVSYFESLDLDPGRYLKDTDSGSDIYAAQVALALDSTVLAAAPSGSHWKLDSKGIVGSQGLTLTMMDHSGLAASVDFKVANNKPMPVNLSLPIPVSGLYGYATRPMIGWLDSAQRVLSVTVDGKVWLLDSTRTLLAHPFMPKPGACVVPAAGGERFYFLGDTSLAQLVSAPYAPAGKNGLRPFEPRAFPAAYSTSPQRCTSSPEGYRLVRWDDTEAVTERFDPASGFSAERRLSYGDSVRVLDALVYGGRIFILRKTRQPLSREREALWLDVLDTALAPAAKPVRIGFYDPAGGDSTLVSLIAFGRLWGSDGYVHVFWAKSDRKSETDIYGPREGAGVYQTVLDGKLASVVTGRRLNHISTGADAAPYLVALDRVSADDLRLYWTNNSGSCGDVFMNTTRVNPKSPQTAYADTGNAVSGCGFGNVHDVSIPFHFGDGFSALYGVKTASRPYLQFQGYAQPVSLASRPYRDRPGARSARLFRRGYLLFPVEEKQFNLLGRDVPIQPAP